MHRIILGAVAFAAGLALTACGGGSQGSVGPDLVDDGGDGGSGGSSDTVVEASEGVIVGEAEDGDHLDPADQWTAKTAVAGYHGSAYLVWKDGSGGETVNATGQGVIGYRFTVETTGTYTLKLRMMEPDTGAGDAHNDVFVGFEEVPLTWNGGTVAAGEVIKMYHPGGNGSWDWGGNIDGGKHKHSPPKITFDTAGTYTLVIHGRSNLLHLDAWALVHEDAGGVDLDLLASAAPVADG